MAGLRVTYKVLDHIYIHANRKLVFLLPVVFDSIKLTYMYVYVYGEHHQLITAESH